MINKIALAGCGNVGTALLEILHEKKDELREKYGFEYKVVLVSDLMKGVIMDPEGLDLGAALESVRETRTFEKLPRAEGSFEELLERSGATVLAEGTPTNLKTGEPGLTHIRAALSRGISVTTTNKGPIALAFDELTELAKANGAQLSYEGVVMSGTPLIDMMKNSIFIIADNLHDIGMSLRNNIFYRKFRIKIRRLFKISYPDIAIKCYSTAIALLFADKNTHHCCLTTAIGCNQCSFISLLYAKTDILKQQFIAISLGNIIYRQIIHTAIMQLNDKDNIFFYNISIKVKHTHLHTLKDIFHLNTNRRNNVINELFISQHENNVFHESSTQNQLSKTFFMFLKFTCNE